MKAERAIGIYSSLFAEQVLSLSLGWGGGRGSNLLGGVELHKLGQVELGLLEDLDLADENVLEGEDLRALFLDLLADLVSDPLIIINRAFAYNFLKSCCRLLLVISLIMISIIFWRMIFC